jgi:hypothetical protein
VARASLGRQRVEPNGPWGRDREGIAFPVEGRSDGLASRPLDCSAFKRTGGAALITTEQTAREKERLPRGWGRFGKAVDYLAEISVADETLLSTCVALNPQFKHSTVTLAGALLELTRATNVILAATDQRLVVVPTGTAGGPRGHYAIPYAGLEIASQGKKDLTLRWSEGEVHFRGAAKQQLPDFLDVVAGRLSS